MEATTAEYSVERVRFKSTLVLLAKDELIIRREGGKTVDVSVLRPKGPSFDVEHVEFEVLP